MIEKVSHVKNPLTVIAIFAGLAEVSGTVVLPFLEKETQQIYVWFLMAFPCLLVLLFFVTLYLKHYVLYAPSDFRDDKLFSDLFERGSGAVRVQKLEEEVAVEAAAEPTSRADPSSPKSPATEQEVAEATVARENVRRDVRATALLAEEFILAKLSRELGVRFDRNVTPLGQPDVMFDAVAISPGRSMAVEVKFMRQGMYPRQIIERPFQRVQAFLASLPDELRRNFQFVFAVATELDSPERIEKLRSSISRVAADFPFSTRVEIFRFAELEKEFGVK